MKNLIVTMRVSVEDQHVKELREGITFGLEHRPYQYIHDKIDAVDVLKIEDEFSDGDLRDAVKNFLDVWEAPTYNEVLVGRRTRDLREAFEASVKGAEDEDAD